MNRLTKPAVALGLAGALAFAVATPSEARDGRNAAAIGAGLAGLAVGAAIGTAASAHYHNGPYGYYGYDRGYAYGPGYTSYGYTPSYNTYGYSTYSPGYAYDSYAYSPRYVDDGAYASSGYNTVTRYNRRDPSSYYEFGGAYGPHSYSGWDNRARQLNAGD